MAQDHLTPLTMDELRERLENLTRLKRSVIKGMTRKELRDAILAEEARRELENEEHDPFGQHEPPKPGISAVITGTATETRKVEVKIMSANGNVYLLKIEVDDHGEQTGPTADITLEYPDGEELTLESIFLGAFDE